MSYAPRFDEVAGPSRNAVAKRSATQKTRSKAHLQSGGASHDAHSNRSGFWKVTRLRAAAERQQLTESALLKRMLQLVLHTTGAAETSEVVVADRPSRQARLYVRLTMGDRQLLQARSAARCLAPATYASNLLRAHLRALTPLPESELRAIRQSTRELAAIGRSLNQIALATHRGGSGAAGRTGAPA